LRTQKLSYDAKFYAYRWVWESWYHSPKCKSVAGSGTEEV